MNWTIEVVSVPVTDVDRAREFYVERLGFNLDYDSDMGGVRVVQVTPPGSGCSICFGKGVVDMPAGSLKGLHMVVPDLKAAYAHLVERGVKTSGLQVYDREGNLQPYRDGDVLDKMGFVFFDDPDGNSWAIQQIDDRA